MFSSLAILVFLCSVQLSHSLCIPEVLHPQTALCYQDFAFKGNITALENTEGPAGQTGVSYEVEVLKVFKNKKSVLVENEVITISTLGSLLNGITWLNVGTEYFMTANSDQTISLCSSYVIEWDNLTLPESVYKWSVADDTFRPTKRCKKCKINYGTPNLEPNVCNYNSESRCHLYERCYYIAELGECAWGKLPQKESGKDCGAEVEEQAEE